MLHLGIYGYRRDTLAKLVRLTPTPLEQCEKLEQLRALEHGIAIRVVQTTHRGVGVDTPGDVHRVEKLLRKQKNLSKKTKALKKLKRTPKTKGKNSRRSPKAR
jgi:CMP-2-keto-3-deoxyoctulosonic acid synthetase